MSESDSLKGSTEAIGSILGRIPGGLFVVTWQEEAVDKTMLTSWLMQAGFNPPAISIAVGTGRRFLSSIDEGDFRFVVNVLSENQRSLISKFGKPPTKEDDPFSGLAIRRSPCGAGILQDSVGWMECNARPVFLPSGPEQSSGDHAIVVADVLAAEISSADPPIVHLRKSGLHY